MSAIDPNLHEQGRKLEVIEARLARHEKVAQRAMAGVMILALSAFGVVAIYLWDVV